VGGDSNFFIKRIVSIFPLYIAIWFLWSVFEFIKGNFLPAWKHLVIAPVEFLMLQSIYDGSFGILHNGGTWFISCIFICYLIYPYLESIIKKNKKKTNIALLILFYLIISYSYVPVYIFKFGDIYANPFFRLLEFAEGIILAWLFLQNKDKNISKRTNLLIPFFIFALIAVISFGVHFGFGYVLLYNFLAVPVFGFILYFCGRLEMRYKICRFQKIISLLSECSYAFFLAQFFCFDITKYLARHTLFFQKGGNSKLFFCSFFFCCIISIFLHFLIEKPIKKFLTKKLYF